VKAVLASREASKAAATAATVAPRKSEALQQELELARRSGQLAESGRRMEQGQAGAVRGYSPYLRALARRSGDGLWLTGVQIQGNGDNMLLRGGPESGLAATISGQSFGRVCLRGRVAAGLHEPQAAPLPVPAQQGCGQCRGSATVCRGQSAVRCG
jgi:hypothetical protein